jgi:signal transduction histidine kinase
MRRISVVVAIVFAFSLGLAAHVYAVGTAQEAKAMVGKAAAFMKANGKTTAFAEFTNQKGQFVKEDLYIFVLDGKGVTLAHGGNPKMVGKDMSGLKDADGKMFIKELIDEANAKGSGWVNYKWTNPASKKIDEKSTYFQKVDDVIFACGIYKK